MRYYEQMLEFKTPELSDKEWVQKALKASDFKGCEYTFGNMYMWSVVYNIKIAKRDGFCFVKNSGGFLFPAGDGSLRDSVFALIHHCEETGEKLSITNVPAESLENLKQLCQDEGIEIKTSTNRDLYDYVYSSEKLVTLSGKKLHSKRNHLNRFYENDWSFEPITPDNIEECVAMHNEWCDRKDIYSDEEKLLEAGAVIRGFDRFFELGLIGGIIRVKNSDNGKNEIRGYSFGEPSGNKSDDTFVVHVEKAFSEIQGAYTAINREFVNFACRDYRFINREEDMGAENLRKAKMSYRPVFMVEKHCVEFRTRSH